MFAMPVPQTQLFMAIFGAQILIPRGWNRLPRSAGASRPPAAAAVQWRENAVTNITKAVINGKFPFTSPYDEQVF